MIKPSLLLLLALSSAQLWAQLETGQITGFVVETSGQAVPVASVTLTSASGSIRRAQTSRTGSYTLAALPPGVYTLEAASADLVPEARQVLVSTASRRQENFTLLRASASVSARSKRATPISPVVHTRTSVEERVFTEPELRQLPELNRNIYRFAELAGNVSDAGLGTHGVGLAINGQRESSTNILLDGTTNNNEFAGSVGQQVPLDAVQELSVFTSNFAAGYGRASGGIVNVISKSGSNRFHGTAYEFNRSSRLASSSFQANAEGIPENSFARNQFGLSLGGPMIHNRLFFFANTEGLLVRSNVTSFAWVPADSLLTHTAANTQAFFQSLGQLRSGVRQIGTVSLNDLAALYGRSPCNGLACATIPATIPLFNHVAYDVPNGSEGGLPQNTWNTLGRVDYNRSDRTRIYFRYAFYKENDPAGALASSPYENYDLGQSQFNNAFLASLTRNWNHSWISQTSVAFNRLTIVQQGLTSRGVVPAMYADPLAPITIGSDSIVFPGYDPFTPGGAGKFGGPQNLFEINHGTTWIKGSHTLQFGGSWRYIRDNRTDGSYQTAVGTLSNGAGIGSAVNALLSGQFAHLQVAVDPQGKYACVGGVVTSSCSLNLPFTSPDFTRSNRFGDAALYAQDYWQIGRRLAVNAGLRWEHFGVQHNRNSNLDSNWYAPGVGFADENLGAYLRRGGLQIASQSSVGGLWQAQWKDFAPRVGFAWDVFGDGRSSFRGGYGIGYERNFGNVTFNLVQNLPNYVVVDLPGPISTNNFGVPRNNRLLDLPRSGARIVNPDIRTAYAHFWGASIQHQITRSIVYSAEYSGSKGVDLYSISYPNQAGFGNVALGDPCIGNGDCRSQPNSDYTEDVGYRGNQGSSVYHGLNNRVSWTNFLHRGIDFTANYTWSHAIDNLSSTFFEAGGTGVSGQTGNQNITINNGGFDAGLLDPYHPDLDRGDAEFDVRHRVTVSGNWQVTLWKRSGWIGALLRGWSLTPIFVARSGQPFSIFDSSAQTLDLNTPRATFILPVPRRRNTFVPSTTPDTFHLITLLPAQIASEPNPLTPGSTFPDNMSRRNAFRAPGFWNLDFGVHKDTRISEKLTLQLRGEAFNLLNHANLYVIGNTADIGMRNTVDGCFGCSGAPWDKRQIQLAARLMF